VAGFCKYGDEPSGSGATELVDKLRNLNFAVSLYCFIRNSGAICRLTPLAKVNLRLTFRI
jgi:hypothetical protein